MAESGGLFKSTGPQVIGAVAVAVVGAVAASMSQAGGWVRDRLFPEQPVVEKTLNVQPYTDTPLQVVVENGSNMRGLTGGTVTLSESSPALTLQGATVLTYGPTKGAAVATGAGDAPTVRISGVEPQQVALEIRTNAGVRTNGVITLDPRGEARPSLTAAVASASSASLASTPAATPPSVSTSGGRPPARTVAESERRVAESAAAARASIERTDAAMERLKAQNAAAASATSAVTGDRTP